MANNTEFQAVHAAITTLSTTQITLIASSVGAVISALVAAAFASINTFIVKKAENERALRELIIKSAIEMHNSDRELAKGIPGGSGILPVEAYAIHLLAVEKVLLNSKLSPSNIKNLLDQIDEISRNASIHLEETRK